MPWRGGEEERRTIAAAFAALDNVFVERLWRSVKCEEIYLKSYRSVWKAAAGIGEWFEFYNRERPHMALGGRTPATVYGL